MRAKQSRRTFLVRGTAAAAATALLTSRSQVSAQDSITFAVIGDYGSGNANEQRVADLVHSWNPAFVTTLGDNVYSADNIDPFGALRRKVGRYYQTDIDAGNFFPSLGNHDWGHPGTPLLWNDANGNLTGAWFNFFNLPGNGRYYDVRRGPVHLFVIDDYYLEPDGNSANSIQARWLRDTALASDAPWKIVVHHFPAFSSNGSRNRLRWPFHEWGIDAVMAGHHHVYERLISNNTLYFVNGMGGAGTYGVPNNRLPESRFAHSGGHGAMRVTASASEIQYEFISASGAVRDSFVVAKNGNPPPPPPPPPGGGGNSPTTSISGPAGGSVVNGLLTVAGTGYAPGGVNVIDLIIKNTATNRYWNEVTGAWQAKFHRIAVIPNNHRQQNVTWSYTVSVPAGPYKARAWSRSVSGNGDPTGNAQTTFTVN